MHLPLLLRLESGPPRTTTFSAEGKGAGGREGPAWAHPAVHPTVRGVRWTDSSCSVSQAQLLLDPPPPLPRMCHYHQELQLRCPCPALGPEPSGGSGWTSGKPAAPFQIWPQHPKGGVGQQLVEILSDSRQEARRMRGLGAGMASRKRLGQSSQHPPPSSPVSNPGLGLWDHLLHAAQHSGTAPA